MVACPPIRQILIVTLVLSGTRGDSVDFEKDIFPIFEARCLECHDNATLKGGIGLETFYHAHLPTDAGEAIFAPGDVKKSVLLHVVSETDPEKRMPPKGDPLSAGEIDLLKIWIEEGAKWPDDGWRPLKHWSYVAPKRSALPEVDHSLLENRHPNEIDFFITEPPPSPCPRVTRMRKG